MVNAGFQIFTYSLSQRKRHHDIFTCGRLKLRSILPQYFNIIGIGYCNFLILRPYALYSSICLLLLINRHTHNRESNSLREGSFFCSNCNNNIFNSFRSFKGWHFVRSRNCLPFNGFHRVA